MRYNLPSNIRTAIIVITCCISPLLLAAKAPKQTSTLLARIDSCVGEARLEAYTTACTKAARLNNIDNEITLLRAYQAEASAQQHIAHETQARTLRLYAFYNNNRSDSLFACMQGDLSFMQKHKQWVSYYSCRSLLVERLQFDKKTQSALIEAKAMYQCALKEQVDYGIGIAAYLIGSCYQGMGRNQEAVDFFGEAEAPFVAENNSGQLHNLYSMEWQSLAALGRYTELLQLTDRWEAMWHSYCKDNNIRFKDIAPYYTVCLLAKAHAFVKSDALADARIALDSAQTFADGQRDIARLLLLKEEALYAEAMGNYPHALEHLNERARIQKRLNNRLSAIETDEMRARIFSKQGNYRNAATLYEALIIEKETLSHLNMAAQLDDLSTIYQVDDLKAEKAVVEVWRNIAFASCGVLVLLIAIYFYHKRSLRTKNIAIVQHMEQQEEAERQLHQIKSIATETLTPDVVLFEQINTLLQDTEVIANPSLDREALAQLLETNTTYIANAIKLGANMKVVAYINRIRIEHACHLIKQEEKHALQVIWASCGFSSRSTFYRVFNEHTGMSPKSYQEVSRKNMTKKRLADEGIIS